jgi:hypothetical protein
LRRHRTEIDEQDCYENSTQKTGDYELTPIRRFH